nr:terminase family protein [uncultured Methanobrevibacter sp.]
MTSTIKEEIYSDNLVLPAESIVDLTPYDIYSTLTVKDSLPAEHVNQLSEALMDIILDDSVENRLCVTQPPRTAKSSLITLSFPFWLILMNPKLNILVVNYNKELANDFGVVLRQLFIDNSDLLAQRDIFLSNVEHAKSSFRFENGKGELLGSIKLVGVGGTITGRDVDICICDDLIKGFVDCTQTLLDKLYEWFKNILIPRLEPHSELFMLGTRWHTQDIIGRLKEEHQDKYRFIELKALNEDGTCIWPNKYTPEFFEERRKEVGDRVFEAQYQGQPLDETGDFFNLDWVIFEESFQYTNPLITGRVRSWDFAYSSEEPGKDNDYTASCKMYRLSDDTYYVTDVTMERYGDDLLKTVLGYAKQDNPNVRILMETGTKGGAAEELYNQYKKHFTGYMTKQSEPVGSKVDRAQGFKQALMQGKIRFVLNPNQREILINQLKGFPLAKHDDLIDALSYAYLELSKNVNNGVKTTNKRKRKRI